MGVYVSLLNECQYCVDHHFQGMCRLIADDEHSQTIKQELLTRDHKLLNKKQQTALDYAQKLTENPASINESMIEGLREQGWDDGEILELNQVVAYFNYANRTVLGLGVHIEGDIIGLSPNNSSDLNDWNHQ